MTKDGRPPQKTAQSIWLGRESQRQAPSTFSRVARRLAVIIGGVAALVAFGVAGYVWIEGWNVLESLYMVVITLGAVGYGEVHALSSAGKVFTMVLIVGGVGLITYAVGAVARLVVEGELQTLLGRRRAMTKIRNL